MPSYYNLNQPPPSLRNSGLLALWSNLDNDGRRKLWDEHEASQLDQTQDGPFERGNGLEKQAMPPRAKITYGRSGHEPNSTNTGSSSVGPQRPRSRNDQNAEPREHTEKQYRVYAPPKKLVSDREKHPNKEFENKENNADSEDEDISPAQFQKKHLLDTSSANLKPSFKRPNGRTNAGLQKKNGTSMNIATAKLRSLTAKEQRLRRILAATVREHMQELTGIKVHKGKHINMPIPDGPPRLNTDGFPYMNPALDRPVTDRQNKLLFKKATELAFNEINDDPPAIMDELKDRVKVTQDILIHFAKTTFRGWVPHYKASQDMVKKSMVDSNKKEARHRRRRQAKLWERLKAVPYFQAYYGWDPTPLLNAGWMSDEDSGPEFLQESSDERPENSAQTLDIEERKLQARREAQATCRWRAKMLAGEYEKEDGATDLVIEYVPKKITMREWHNKMLGRLGIRRSEENSDIPILEVVDPGWRSEKATDVYHELSRVSQKWITSRLPGQGGRARVYRRVKNSGRFSDAPTLVTPYPMLVNELWMEDAINEGWYQEQVNEWKQFTNPPELPTIPQWMPHDQLYEIKDEELEAYLPAMRQALIKHRFAQVHDDQQDNVEEDPEDMEDDYST